MTAHLAWPQPQYERIRAGLSPRLRDVAARASYVLSTGSRRSAAQREPSRRTRREPEMHFEAKKIVVVGGSAGWGGRSRSTSSITAAAR